MSAWRRSEKIERLGRIPLFEGLARRHLNRVVSLADEVCVPEGTTLMREGQIGQELIYILDGQVRVERNGRAVDRLGADDFLGEISLLDGGPRTATVVTECETHLLVIRESGFRRLLAASPSMQRRIIEALCRYLRESLLLNGLYRATGVFSR